jgi:hypothetical protein
MAWPVVPNGVLPLMALTVKGDLPSPVAGASKATVYNCGYAIFNRIYEGSANNVQGTATLTLTGLLNPDEVLVIDEMPQLIYTPSASSNTVGYYSVTLVEKHIVGTQIVSTSYDVMRVSDNGTSFFYDELVSDSQTYYIHVNGTKYTFKMKNVEINYRGTSSILTSVKKLSDDTTIYAVSLPVRIYGCLPYYSADRCGYMWIGGSSITGAHKDGVYYLEVTFDNTTYYSEPFLWYTDMSNFTMIKYRRSSVIVTKKNFIDFKNYLNNTYHEFSIYIRNVAQRPPYQFNTEVTDIDGRKFAEKQVSFYNKHIAFNCYEAFLETIRLLWHCDVRYIGSRRIDYMEQPEVDWNTDNHLCDVVLEMSNYDDVIQTNGTASSYFDSSDSSHQSYDASFDASFE